MMYQALGADGMTTIIIQLIQAGFVDTTRLFQMLRAASEE